jgi:hypothetical protein
MQISTQHLPDALGGVLSNSLSHCEETFKLYNKTQHGGTRDALLASFNSSYDTLLCLKLLLVRDWLTTQTKLDWDKVTVYYNTINNLNKTLDVENLVWFNRNTGEIEERC